MNLLASLVLLLSASDSFDSLAPGWHLGSRQALDISFVTVESDSCLVLRSSAVGDWVREFPRPVLRSERPIAVVHLWLPPFEQWPTREGNYCGFRLTIQNQNPRYVWPGIFISRSGGVPTFTVRVLTDTTARVIGQPGWWTLGMRCDSTGALLFYAARDKVSLTDSDLFYTDPSGVDQYGIPYGTHVASFDGWFLQVATPEPWFFGEVQLWCNIRPSLDISRQDNSVQLMMNGYPSESYQIERSTDLLSWQAFASVVQDSLTTDAIAKPQQFYRIAP